MKNSFDILPAFINYYNDIFQNYKNQGASCIIKNTEDPKKEG